MFFFCSCFSTKTPCYVAQDITQRGLVPPVVADSGHVHAYNSHRRVQAKVAAAASPPTSRSRFCVGDPQHQAIPHRSRVDPEVATENAQSKVARLHKALEAVGDMGGVVVESLQAELAKAQTAAMLPPIDVQISKCKEFIERSERRLVWLEAETVIEKEALSEGRARLAGLEQDQRSRQPHGPVPQTEVRVEQSMEEISHLRTGAPDPKRVCRLEDVVPMCDEEMHEWLEARQKDLHTARVSGQHSEGGKLCASYARVAAPTDGVVAVHPCAHGEVTSHQCGLNGVRGSSFVPERQTHC